MRETRFGDEIAAVVIAGLAFLASAYAVTAGEVSAPHVEPGVGSRPSSGRSPRPYNGSVPPLKRLWSTAATTVRSSWTTTLRGIGQR